MNFPSGDTTGELSKPGSTVSCLALRPSASQIQMSGLLLAFDTYTSLPSGVHAGFVSNRLVPAEICEAVDRSAPDAIHKWETASPCTVTSALASPDTLIWS